MIPDRGFFFPIRPGPVWKIVAIGKKGVAPKGPRRYNIAYIK